MNCWKVGFQKGGVVTVPLCRFRCRRTVERIEPHSLVPLPAVCWWLGLAGVQLVSHCRHRDVTGKGWTTGGPGLTVMPLTEAEAERTWLWTHKAGKRGPGGSSSEKLDCHSSSLERQVRGSRMGKWYQIYVCVHLYLIACPKSWREEGILPAATSWVRWGTKDTLRKSS
jgi:hypothetical protein